MASVACYIPSNLARLWLLRMLGVQVGHGTAIHRGILWRSPWNVTIGRDVFVAERVALDGRGGLTIGDSVSINTAAQIWTAQHDWRSSDFAYVSSATAIGDHAWISAGVIVLPGIRIGRGAVVAAGAVVTHDLDEWSLYAGVPARKIADRPRVDSYMLGASKSKVWFA